jgi:uncharacterized membrane protein YqgA involved in biofilm formation
MALKQLGIGLLSLSLGSAAGRLLGLQKGVNRLGKWARNRFETATNSEAEAQGKWRQQSDGFVTCTLLFCVGPMAILGAIQDGLEGKWQTLGLKGVLDGLAAMGFVSSFGWGPILAAIPVLAYQGTITLAAGRLEPLLHRAEVKDSIGIAGGFVVACIAVVILEVRKVPLADYLPALIVAPLLTAWWL